MNANFIISGIENDALVITDVGPWDKYKTVTNDIENVTKLLWDKRLLIDKNGNQRRLFYIDSEGVKDEIRHEKGKFVKFIPGNNVWPFQGKEANDS
jgi:hypothetical protein